MRRQFLVSSHHPGMNLSSYFSPAQFHSILHLFPTLVFFWCRVIVHVWVGVLCWHLSNRTSNRRTIFSFTFEILYDLYLQTGTRPLYIFIFLEKNCNFNPFFRIGVLISCNHACSIPSKVYMIHKYIIALI